MTQTVASTSRPPSVLSPWMIGLLAAAILIGVGAALLPRGPDLSYAPVMADQPVVFADGSQLYVQKYEVTVAEWNICHAAGACDLQLRAGPGKSPDTLPATGLSYVDVSQYLVWINGQSSRGHSFRLPTLLEWEYMAAEVLPPDPDPIFTDPELSWASAYLMEPATARTLRPQGSFDTTSQGITDLNGSVWEWTQECYSGVAEGQITPDRCPAFFVGGEHVAAMSYLERDPARGGCAVGAPPAHLGMRLVSDEPV